MVALDGTVPSLLQAELAQAIDNILRLDDTDDNGLIEYSEFVAAMRRNRERYQVASVIVAWLWCMSEVA